VQQVWKGAGPEQQRTSADDGGTSGCLTCAAALCSRRQQPARCATHNNVHSQANGVAPQADGGGVAGLKDQAHAAGPHEALRQQVCACACKHGVPSAVVGAGPGQRLPDPVRRLLAAACCFIARRAAWHAQHMRAHPPALHTAAGMQHHAHRAARPPACKAIIAHTEVSMNRNAL